MKDPVRSSSELEACEALGCVVTDPQDGTNLHWDLAFLTRSQPEKVAPQCDQLCEKCLQLAIDISQRFSKDKQNPDTEWTYESEDSFDINHHKTIGMLRLVAAAGCHFCALISHFGSKLAWAIHNLLDSSPYFLHFEHESDSDDPAYWLDFEVFVVTTEGRYHAACLRPGISRDEAYDSSRHCITMTLRFRSTEHPKVLDLARQWLDRCATTHDICCLPATPTRPKWSPTRLIRISASGDSVGIVRLVVNAILSESKGYLTLSHRWGGASIVKLTKDSFDSFLTDIPLRKLSKTFRDAILVTRHLGFEYLWIDSLCIIQDSADDWLQESKSMGKVYRHSQCTIAAAKARDGDDGLFTERNVLSMDHCQLLGSQQDGPQLWSWTFFEQDLKEHFPLYTRAWVLQEECLFRRRLDFEHSQISWHCLVGQALESEPFMNEQELGTKPDGDLIHQFEHILRDLHLEEMAGQNNISMCEVICFDSVHWLRNWWSIVNEYTARTLTYVTDRGPAISGLIDLISEARKMPFAHGMCVPYLVCDLLWRIWRPIEERIATDAPSWSWISMSRAVENACPDDYYGLLYRTAAVLDHSTAIVSVDETMSLQRAGVPSQILRITAHMLEVRKSNPVSGSTGPKRMDATTYVCDTSYLFRLRDGREQEKDWNDLEDLEACWDGDWQPDTPFDPTWNLVAVHFLEALQFPEIVRHERPEFKGHPYRMSTGLMVVPVDAEANIYRRVGLFKFRWYSGGGNFQCGTFYQHADSWTLHEGERWLGERQTIWLT